MPDAKHLTALHDEANRRWHSGDALSPSSELGQLVLANHRANFDLWHEEDKARDPSASSSAIATVKHAIDRFNQQRNDLIERIDLALIAALPAQNETASLHSETPGLILDRLSILSLKLYHTAEETRRGDATHRQRNSDRLAILTEQRDDLAACLNTLLDDVAAGRRRFKLYRQMKMYNDPSLNPVLYSQSRPPDKS